MESVFKDALRHISSLARLFSNRGDITYVITLLLMELGFPSHIVGFSFLVDAIGIFEEDFKSVALYGLYPCIAKRYDEKIDSKNIEQTIRDAIKKAWGSGNQVVWCYYFPKGKKPTSEEFIAQIARILHLWKGSCEAQKDRTERQKEEEFYELR